jgi:hypothetical protein
MCIRTRGTKQIENVSLLLDRLPKCFQEPTQTEIAFDRGYGKMSFIEGILERNLHIKTIANGFGSRHPFILRDEKEKKVKEWKASRKVSETEIERRLLVIEDWVFDNDEKLGAECKIAQKQIGSKTLNALVVRDIFDRNKDALDLRFFSTRQSAYQWVAIPKRWSPSKHILFCEIPGDERRQQVEQRLREKCHPLTLDQRSAKRNSPNYSTTFLSPGSPGSPEMTQPGPVQRMSYPPYKNWKRNLMSWQFMR